MKKEQLLADVPYSMLKLIMEYMKVDKEIRCYGTDTQIYNSEIHIISAIAKNPEINVKGLAEHFDITSASVSEILSKLVKKGLVEKNTDKDNLTRVKISLTTKGRLAHEEHMRYHAELDEMITKELSNASEEQVSFILNFFKHMQARMKEFQF